MNKPFFGLPEKVYFCNKCVISNQRPSSTVEFINNIEQKKETIGFGNDGICSACKFQDFKNSQIDWSKREKELLTLFDKHRKSDGDYDVIVPGSGGKDSAYTSHLLKYKYGMNPLTVTWAPHKYTEIGWKNFENWLHIGGFDNILFTPNGKLHRYLTRLAFLNLLHPFQPFIVGQRTIGPRMADKFNVKLIMYGENQAEYGNSIEDNNSPIMQNKFFSSSSSEELKIGGETVKNILKTSNFKINDFNSYLPVSSHVIESKKIEVHYLGYYIKWDPQECYYYAVENTGFESNTERTEGTYSKYSSIDDEIDMFHYYTTLIKFGIGRATYDAAQEIRNGKITREEGVALVKKFDQEFPAKYFNNFLEYISISEKEFFDTVDRFRSPVLWSKKDSIWELNKPIWKNIGE